LKINFRFIWYSESVLLLMRWLLIALFVSLAALLMAVAGVALHIWRQRARLHSKSPAETEEVVDPSRNPPGEASSKKKRQVSDRIKKFH
jgi:hypothetical protein